MGHIFQIQSVTPLETVAVTSSNQHQKLHISSHSRNFRNRTEGSSQSDKSMCTEDISPEVEALIGTIDLSELNEIEKEQARQLLQEEVDVFCSGPDDIGNVKGCQMKINLKDKTPVQKSYYSMPKPLHIEVKNYIIDLLNKGWIRKSKSNYSPPIVAVRKKDGTLRLCCDYRALNSKTVPDRHPIPRIQDVLDYLHGKKWFSVLDQKKAYHQIYLDSESQPLTAFITPWGLYEWIRVPFGLTNAPAEFQRFMEDSLFDVRDEFAFPYLDDVIVFSDSFTSHLEHLRIIFRRLKEKGIKINPEKCKFFQKKVNFLGRVISEDDYQIDESNITAVTSLAKTLPTNLSELRHMLGLLGYYRKYVQNFSRIAQPLFNLLKCEEGQDNKTRKKTTKIIWGPEHQKSLTKILTVYTNPPILSYPDFASPFILHVDASNKGLGCALYQKVDNQINILGYGSRTLNKTEQKYHSTKLEFLALKWSVTEHFRDYPQYASVIDVYTDNNPLVYILSTAKLNATGQRWANELADFNLRIHYKPGKSNTDADYFSRFPQDIREYSNTSSNNNINNVINSISNHGDEAWLCAINANNSLTKEEFKLLKSSDKVFQQVDIIKAQDEDVDIKRLKEIVDDNIDLTSMQDKQQESTLVRRLLRERAKLKVTDKNLLVRSTNDVNQIVLPSSLRWIVFQELHENMAHLGADRVYHLAKERVYWPNMEREIKEYITTECQCMSRKRPRVIQHAPLGTITSSAPMDIIAFDFLKVDRCSGRYEYILVIVNHFYPLRTGLCHTQ